MAEVGKTQDVYHSTKSLAAILAIGTSNPPNYMYQADYPDFYFRVTKSEHLMELKEKFKHMCEKSAIRKRHLHLTEEVLNENPSICSGYDASIGARQDIVVKQLPKMAMEASLKAIKEWGQSKSKITHLIFSSIAGVDMPGADLHLARLLGLQPSVKRIMLYQQGCYISATMLGMAKDIAEHDAGSRVLVVSSEMGMMHCFRPPYSASFDSLAAQLINGDGAGALIIGADHMLVDPERPLFHVVSESQTTIPYSHEGVRGQLRETGLTPHFSKDVPALISQNVEKCLVDSFSALGISTEQWNSLFWIVQPSSLVILNLIESMFELKQEKLSITRRVLSEFGSLASASIFFIMDEMRRRSLAEKKKTTGEGMEWGVVVGYGAGLTIETVVLRSASLSPC
ncbi:hypothetical protein K2173_022992 [Erythroxylum novogranatense]|uniref:Chalcone synthase n=1 Tax=Erythroxylum novogranatense TaxID=1862640 RepID=A0AAV8T9K0_9ROSI|nr:hypothetical protein K2173_022992 [Erythroxylum novogranatense]